ncbi:hypothetical protein LXA43DRAFT_1096351 [Ganoderma leucocontextum]|nr:hypothetical protein LXA43DRAFT_1096351 [Ganoderma leucocontextum]
MSFSESKLSARYIDQDLEALERVAESLLNRCKHLRGASETEGLQPLRLQQTILSGITAIQGVKNMTRPVNRLPAEILIDIFALLPRAHPVLEGAALTGQHWPFVIPENQLYLELAKVCRRWRDILFDTPSFWSVVSESFPREHTKIPDMWQVDRCPSGPLTVHIRGIVSRRMWKLLHRGAPRVRQLHIDNLDSAQGEAMRKLLHSFSATNLEHCKLHIPLPSRIKEPVYSLFSGSGAKLRSLYLDRPSFLPSNTFPMLTYLTIFLFNVSGEVHWSMGNLCHLLSGSPLLEELHLHLIWPYLPRSLPTHHAPQLNLSRLRAFTFHMFNVGGEVTTSNVLEAFLPLVGLPPSCRRVDLGPVSIGDLETLAPYILSLDQPRTRMRLTLVHPRGTSYFHSIRYSGTDLALEFASSAQPDSGVRLLLKPVAPGDFPPNFPKSPLLANVEEVWVKTNVLSNALLRNVLLPPKARSLALTILDRRLQAHTLAPLVDDIHRRLDTLCIVASEGNAHVVRDSLVYQASTGRTPNGSASSGSGLGPDSRGRHRARIRRVALGYIAIPRGPSLWPKTELNSTGAWRDVGAEFSWIGPVDGVDPARASDGSEMENLFRAAPELLTSPATVRSGWPVF